MTLTTNKNLLLTPNFQFVCDRLPNVDRFISQATLPSISVNFVRQPTGLFADVKQHGDRLTYSTFQISITMDEDLTAYVEVLEWLQNMTKPENVSQYQNPAVPRSQMNSSKFADISLYTLTNKGNRNILFTFTNAHPTAVTFPQLNQQNTTSDPIQFTVDFEYDIMSVSKVK